MADSMRSYEEEAGGAEWFLELDNATLRESTLSNLSQLPAQQQLQNNSTWDTDSGYEPSPAYFAIERRFEYPPIIQDADEDEIEDEFDDVFVDEVFSDSPTHSFEMSTTPRSQAIPIPPRRESTPTDEETQLIFSRPRSAPLREPEFELDSDDFLDSEEEVEQLIGDFQTHSNVSTQTEWMLDEEIEMIQRRRVVSSNVPDVVPRRAQRSTLPRRAVSFNEADYVSIGSELRRLSDRWEHSRLLQRRALERRQSFIEFVINAIMACEEPRRARVPPPSIG